MKAKVATKKAFTELTEEDRIAAAAFKAFTEDERVGEKLYEMIDNPLFSRFLDEHLNFILNTADRESGRIQLSRCIAAVRVGACNIGAC